MQVVVDMAAKGLEAFDQRITSLVDEWRLQLFNADFTPTLTSLNADVDFDEIYAQNRRASPALEAHIDPVSDSAPSMQVASTQGAAALRRRKRMVLEPDVIMNRAFTRSMSRALAERDKEQITDIIHTAFDNAAKEAETSRRDEEGDEVPEAPTHVESSSTQPIAAAAEGLFSQAPGPSQDEQQPGPLSDITTLNRNQENIPNKMKKLKKTRLLLDARTELTDEELKVSRAMTQAVVSRE